MGDWSRPFEAPIALPSGGALHTLRDAGEFIQGLPKAAQSAPAWLAAAEALLLVVQHNGPVMFAAIAVRQALSTDRPRPAPAPRRRRVKAYRVVS